MSNFSSSHIENDATNTKTRFLQGLAKLHVDKKTTLKKSKLIFYVVKFTRGTNIYNMPKFMTTKNSFGSLRFSKT